MSTREVYAKSRPYQGGLMVAGEGFEPSKAEPGDLQNPQSVGSGSGSDCSDLRKGTQEHECFPSKSNPYHARTTISG